MLATPAALSRTRFAVGTLATVERRGPPADPHRLRFRTSSPGASSGTPTEKATLGVDANKGVINRVSLMTANREAAGHGVWIDEQTLTSFQALLSGRRFKSYVTHSYWGDDTLEEPGYWESSEIDGINLRANFVALAAWRKHKEAEFDTLFELAEKLPEEFGVSLSFRMALAWVRKDGSEVETKIKYREAGWSYEKYFDPAAPADAVRTDMPSVRAVEVYSADFVSDPAANDGLFESARVDAPGFGNSPHPLMLTTKQIHERFSANPAHVARAIALSVANEKLTLDEIALAITREDEATAFNQLRLDHKKLADESATFATQLKAKDDEINTLKTQAQKDADTIAAFRKGGTLPVDLGAKKPEDSSTALSKTKAEFDAMKPYEKMEFSSKGGRISD